MSVDRCEHCEDVGRRAVVRCLLPALPYGDLPHIGVCRTHCVHCKIGEPDGVRPRAPTPADMDLAAETQRRFGICCICPRSMKSGYGCQLHEALGLKCFAGWRRMPRSVCHDDPPRWRAFERTDGKESGRCLSERAYGRGR